jgi:hypothetical protein
MQFCIAPNAQLERRIGQIFQNITRLELPGFDDDLDRGVRSETGVITSVMLRVPVPNAPFDLAEKVEASLLGQVAEITDQVRDGMIVTGAAVTLKSRDSLGSPVNVVGFIDHTFLRPLNRSANPGATTMCTASLIQLEA